MPDPGQAPQPGGPPQQGPPQGQPQGGQGGGGVAGLMQNVGEALDHIKTAISQAQVPPEIKQMIDQVCQMYGQFIEAVQGGGGAEPEGEGQGQTVPPEAGGNKGAVPSM